MPWRELHARFCTLNNNHMIQKKKKKKKEKKKEGTKTTSSISSTHPAIEISTPRDYHHLSFLYPPAMSSL